MNFPRDIFKAYDIRGLVDGELSEELAYGIGRAFVEVLKKRNIELEGKKLIVGQDMRPTSPVFAAEVIRAIQDEGIDVVDIGMTSTPVFNFTCADNADYAGGVMVTASHNPAEYNGFKLTMSDGLPIGKETGMDDLRYLVEVGNFSEPVSDRGTVEELDVREAYIEKIFSLVDPTNIKPLKVVIDGGNGMGEMSFPLWLERLPVEVEYLYMEPDGSFPNHEANPLKEETLKDLQKKVLEVGADFGFALDGDADRIGLVDEKGQVVSASFVSALLGKEFLRTHKNPHMLYDLRSSRVLQEVFEGEGATTKLCMVGHANIKKMMREVNAQYASELSLHIFFGDMHYLESTDLCLLYFFQLLTREKQPLSELVAPFQVYSHSGEINFEVEDKEAVMKKLREHYIDLSLEEVELDGLWLRMEWGWFSVRQSNTEPVLRLNLETKDPEVTKQKVAELTALISS